MPLLQLIRWMCSISMKDRSTSEELRMLVGVVPITNVIRSGRLRWYGHVMRTGQRNVWSIVNRRRHVRRPRGAWLESVKADMA